MHHGIFICTSQNYFKNKYQLIEFQGGVIRSNCMDCLDRTNSFQLIVAELALKIQIAKIMGKTNINLNNIELSSQSLELFRKTFEDMGDILSIQYGSSLAHNQIKKYSKQAKRFELFTSITRHLKNNFRDEARQNQIDLFLRQFNVQEYFKQIKNKKINILHYPKMDFIKNIIERENWHQLAVKAFEQDYQINLFNRISTIKMQVQNRKYSMQKIQNSFNRQQYENLRVEQQINKKLQFVIKIPQIFFNNKVWYYLKKKKIKNHYYIENKLKKEYNICSFFSYFFNKYQDNSPNLKNVSIYKPILENDLVQKPKKTIQHQFINHIQKQVENFFNPTQQITSKQLQIINYHTLDDQSIKEIKSLKPQRYDFHQAKVEQIQDLKNMRNRLVNQVWVDLGENDAQFKRPLKKQTSFGNQKELLRVMNCRIIVLMQVMKKSFSQGIKISKIEKL